MILGLRLCDKLHCAVSYVKRSSVTFTKCHIGLNFRRSVSWILFHRFSDHEWLEKIEDKYFDERDDIVRQFLQAAYDDVRDVYAFLLHVIFKGFIDLYSKRIPISYYAMDELDIWLKLKVSKFCFRANQFK